MVMPASGCIAILNNSLQTCSSIAQAVDGNVTPPKYLSVLSATGGKSGAMTDFYGYGATALLTNLVGCWEMDATSGTIIYDKTGSNNLTLAGTYVLNQAGKPVKSVRLNAGTASASSYLVSAFPITIAYWFNLTSVYAYYASNYQNYYYGVQQQHHPANWVVHFGNGTNNNSAARSSWTSTVSPPSYGTWYHAVLVATAHNTFTFYVNGSPKTLTYNSGTASYTNFAGGVYNLGYNGTQGYYYVGQNAIWNRALTQTDVTALYNGGNGLAYASW